MSLGERAFIVLLKLPSKERLRSAGGRLSISFLNALVKERWVNVDGSGSPKARWVSLFGNASASWLKYSPNVRWVSIDGRVTTGWLKSPRK